MVWWCPSGSPSVRPTLRPSVRPGLRPPVFRTFLIHALTNWAKIVHMTLFSCTTDQVRVSSISVNFCRSYAPFGMYNTENTHFSALFSYTLWLIQLKFCVSLCLLYYRSSSSVINLRQVLWELCLFWNLEYWKYSFPHFSLTRFGILSWNFAYAFVCKQGALTLPDTWFRPPFWDLLMLQLLRPNSSNLPCLYSTFHLEYPLVLSRFCFWWSYTPFGT